MGWNRASSAWIGHTSFVQIFSCLEQSAALGNFDLEQRWFEGNNNDVVGTQISPFFCPSDDAAGRFLTLTWIGNGLQISRSNYVLCFGSSTFHSDYTGFVQQHGPNDPEQELNTVGAFRFLTARKLSKIFDGKSNTALCSDVIAGENDVGITTFVAGHGRWWSPFHMGTSAYTQKNTPNSSVPDGVPNGSCDIIPCAPSGDESLGHATTRSRHPGGVNLLFADGHVSFYADDIDIALWRALSTISTGETL